MDAITSSLIVVFGIVNPVYSTYRSVRNKTQQTRLLWLRYWVVFGLFYSLTCLTDYILFWLPFYNVLKILFVLWISSSKASGAQVVFSYALVPALKDYEKNLDRFVSSCREKVYTLLWQCIGVQFNFLHIFFRTAISMPSSGDDGSYEATCSSSSSSLSPEPDQ